MNKNKLDKNTLTLEQNKELKISHAELNEMLDQHIYPFLKSRGKETVIWDKESVSNTANMVNKKLSGITEKKVETFYEQSQIWQNKVWARNNQQNETWESIRKGEFITDIMREKIANPWNFSNILNFGKFVQENKKTPISELKTNKETISLDQSKPLGSAGDITLNELINKGIEVIDTPLVKMIKENVDVSCTTKLCGSFVTSMILYRSIMNIYVKSAYGSGSLTGALRTGSTSRGKEVAFFMLMGAPFIAGALMGINYAVSGSSKVIVNIAESNNLEGTGTSSGSSSSSLFLALAKLPNWIKIILRYIALCLIFTFITSVIGYKSNIIVEIYSQFYIYLGYFLKLYCILNFFVIIYFIWKLYIIIMFANNKDYIIPDYYPKFLKNELLESKDIADNIYSVDPEGPKKVYKHYLKLIFLYISIVIFGLSVMIFSPIYAM